MIYILVEISGEYDSYSEVVIAASLDETKLCSHRNQLQQVARKQHKLIPRLEIRDVEEIK